MERRPAINPRNQPFVDAIWDHLERENMTFMALCEALKGRDADGQVKGSGAIHSLIRGKNTPTIHTIENLKERTGIDLTHLIPIASNLGRHATPVEGRALALTPVRQVVSAFERERGVVVESRRAKPSEPPLLNLIIDQGGRASVSLNLVGVSADEATRLVGMLAGAGILKGNKCLD